MITNKTLDFRTNALLTLIFITWIVIGIISLCLVYHIETNKTDLSHKADRICVNETIIIGKSCTSYPCNCTYDGFYYICTSCDKDCYDLTETKEICK